MNRDRALALARFLLNSGAKMEDAVKNPEIPEECREWILFELKKELNITLEPAHFVTAGTSADWLQNIDRADWYYWPRLRRQSPEWESLLKYRVEQNLTMKVPF